jgi:hypothetical protein
MRPLPCLWLFAYFAALIPDAACAQQSLGSLLAQRGPVAEDMRTDAVAPSASTAGALRAMFADAGVVFAGEVMHVSRGDGFVDVVFRVDEAVRGARPGTLYTLREWSGLWTDHVRYVVGQRLLMLLHATSVAGYSSPVGGMDGAIPVSGDVVAGTVDLRWVAARVGRQVDTVVTVVLRAEPSNAVAMGGDALPLDTVAHTDRGVVMDLLHAWQRSAALR